MRKTIIIAEAGVNHNGNMELAKQLIDVAVNAGVDYVKFQTFKSSKLVSPSAKKADYQKENTGNVKESQLQMLQKLELSEADHHELIAYCASKKINFFSTAFDLESLEFLNTLGLKMYKIPSGEITNLPYLERIAEVAEEIVLSTGMSTLGEIGDAIAVIKSISKAKITVLHCNTQYPTPFYDVNLLAMNQIKEVFGVEIGYSDHTLGIEVPIAAVALGATVIEKHFTLDRTLPGPDHAASLEPAELREMVKSIRNIENALGSDEKMPSDSEMANIAIARKSIHLAVDKAAGEVITANDLEMLRPGDGISPMKMRTIIGKIVNKDLEAGHKLNLTDF